SNIMRDMMLVNFTGLAGHFMAIDLNIEHIIGYLKLLFLARGMHGSWERLGDISAAIVQIQFVKKQIGLELGTKYNGISHTTPDTSASVFKVRDKILEFGLITFQKNREGNDTAKPTTDILLSGEKKLRSSTLKTVNKKIRNLASGIIGDVEEEDEL
ncbi:hypothetical protein PLICRDRAFT_70357, partial [Plicaturopsis crispa FD-325 SS-3]